MRTKKSRPYTSEELKELKNEVLINTVSGAELFVDKVYPNGVSFFWFDTVITPDVLFKQYLRKDGSRVCKFESVSEIPKKTSGNKVSDILRKRRKK